MGDEQQPTTHSTAQDISLTRQRTNRTRNLHDRPQLEENLHLITKENTKYNLPYLHLFTKEDILHNLLYLHIINMSAQHGVNHPTPKGEHHG